LEGLAPYNYEIQTTMFISQNGDVSFRFTGTKDLLITQRLILQPRLELNAAVQEVERFSTGTGLNDIEFGLRLRYEIRRQFAPYIGVSLERSFFDSEKTAAIHAKYALWLA
jgi:copper resistance protein B